MFDNIVKIEEIRENQDLFCGLAIGEEDYQDKSGTFTHIVFLYKFNDQLKGMHYFDHKIISENTGRIEEKYYLGIKMSKSLQEYFPDKDSQTLLASLCETVVELNQDILYSFEYKNECFNIHGKLISKDDDNATFGLTCSTLILALFKSDDIGGIDLLDIDNWEVTEEDTAHINNVCEYFMGQVEEGNEDQKAILEKMKSFHRYRAEDIAISFLSNSNPCTYEICRSNIKYLQGRITDGE